MTKFTYFENHGDDDGKNCFTICFGEPNGDEIIIGVEDKKKDAKEMCKRLNAILKQVSQESYALGKKFKQSSK